MSVYHVPVLFDESLEGLAIRPAGIYVDLTFGGGGHSRGILHRLGPQGRLFAFDQDRDARANLPEDPRLTFVESNFRFMHTWLRYYGIERVDGILADLGVSSHHFDTQQRGFSFRYDAPLDMRMNQRARLTAADVVNGYDHVRLTALLRDYGELDSPHRITQCIERSRAERPLAMIDELIAAVAPVTPRGGESKFLAKLFQALRIEVNGEMEALKMMLDGSGRAAGGDYLSFARRPAGEEFYAQRQLRGKGRKRFLRPGADAFRGRYPQGGCPDSGGDRTQSPFAECGTADS